MTIIHVASALLALNILVDIAGFFVERSRRRESRKIMAENARLIERLEAIQANRIPTHHTN